MPFRDSLPNRVRHSFPVKAPLSILPRDIPGFRSILKVKIGIGIVQSEAICHLGLFKGKELFLTDVGIHIVALPGLFSARNAMAKQGELKCSNISLFVVRYTLECPVKLAVPYVCLPKIFFPTCLRNVFDSIAQIEKGHHVGSLVAEGVGPTEGKPHVLSLSEKNPEVSELNIIPRNYFSLEAVALMTSVDDLCLMFAIVLFTRC